MSENVRDDAVKNSLKEFDFINKIKSMRQLAPYKSVLDMGDDCFVYDLGGGRGQAVTVDLLIEDVHFAHEFITPFELGRKAAAVNLSDMAAMGATPRYAFLGLSLPKHEDAREAEIFVNGLLKELEGHGAALAGGDLTGGSKWSISLTLIGDVSIDAMLRRNTFRPGQKLAVTGTVGDSAAGLNWLLNHSMNADVPVPEDISSFLVEAHHLPVPRVREALFLAEKGVRAGIDLSDGLGSDCRRVAQRSDCGMFINMDTIPISKQLRAYCAVTEESYSQYAISGGEDYELLVGLPAHDAGDIIKEFNETFPGVGLTVIGEVTEGNELKLRYSDGSIKPLPGPKYRHFSS